MSHIFVRIYMACMYAGLAGGILSRVPGMVSLSIRERISGLRWWCRG